MKLYVLILTDRYLFLFVKYIYIDLLCKESQDVLPLCICHLSWLPYPIIWILLCPIYNFYMLDLFRYRYPIPPHLRNLTQLHTLKSTGFLDVTSFQMWLQIGVSMALQFSGNAGEVERPVASGEGDARDRLNTEFFGAPKFVVHQEGKLGPLLSGKSEGWNLPRQMRFLSVNHCKAWREMDLMCRLKHSEEQMQIKVILFQPNVYQIQTS